MNLQPLHDQILVQRAKAEDVSAGGIIIPENAKRKSRHGKILAAGSGRILSDGSIRPLDVKVGDTVYFRGTSGQEVSFEQETYVLLREDDIEAVGDE